MTWPASGPTGVPAYQRRAPLRPQRCPSRSRRTAVCSRLSTAGSIAAAARPHQGEDDRHVLARARTCAGSSPSVIVPQHWHCFACATYSVTLGAGAGAISVTWWRRCAATGSPARPSPHPRHADGGNSSRSSGSSTRRIVVPGSPGCFPGRRFPRSRADGSRPCFLCGLSDDGGLDDVDESLRACRSRSSTRPCKAVTCADSSPCAVSTDDQPVRLSQPHRQLGMRQPSQLLCGGNTRHVGHNRQSSPARPARQRPATACRGKPGKSRSEQA